MQLWATMADKTTMSDKQYLAKILYTREKLEGKTIAQKVGVSEKTISNWVTNFGWKNLRNRLLVGKEEILQNLYEQLEELNKDIQSNKDGKRYGTSAQADTMIKYTASIRNLESDLSIADVVDAGIKFMKHLQVHGSMEQVVEFSDLWNGFIQSEIKKR